MYIYRVGVVGAGTMGAQIAQVVSYAGLPVVLTDVVHGQSAAYWDGNREDAHTGGEDEGGRRSAWEILSFSTGCDFTALQDVDLVIEAVSENLALKRQVLHDLDAGCAPGAI